MARELGIRVILLYKWRKEQEEFEVGSFPGKGHLKLSSEQEKIYQLEKKRKDVELERDILKKAIDILFLLPTSLRMLSSLRNLLLESPLFYC